MIIKHIIFNVIITVQSFLFPIELNAEIQSFILKVVLKNRTFISISINWKNII